MNFHDSFEYAWRAIFEQKRRAFFTIIGITIGIASMIALLSLGAGFEQSVETFFTESFETNVMTVSKQESFHSRTDFETLIYANDSILLEAIPNVEIAVPIIQKQVEVEFDNDTMDVTLYGIPFADYSTVFTNFLIHSGQIPGSIGSDTNEIVIGNSLFHENMINISVALGSNITFYWSSRVNGSFQTQAFEYEIVGILESLNGYSYFGAPSDNSLYIPLENAKDIFDTDECSLILLVLSDDSSETVNQVSSAIREIYGDHVGIFTLSSMIDSVNSAMVIVTAFLAAIAAISLIVAGVGIMNIMTISFMERTREIGILKSLGIVDSHLLGTFLLESLILGLLGVIFGHILGILLSYLASSFISYRIRSGTSILESFSTSSPLHIEFSPVFSIAMFLATTLFGLGITLLFGFIPAKRASKLSPVSAITHF